MANSLDTLQQKTSFSVNRESFLDRVVKNEDLSKKDLRVLLLLLTSLPGFCDRPTRDDPKKFEAVHPKAIAKTLNMKKKDVDECLEYHDILHEVADQQIGFDLDDGVVVNYAKFGDVLAKIK